MVAATLHNFNSGIELDTPLTQSLGDFPPMPQIRDILDLVCITKQTELLNDRLDELAENAVST